ncbi:hypothetical protein [Jeotgalibacillus sp. JSM ZJ347]|uniref:hypothetical protein n=1 Tax=Jeotgalibacillus sp. JSM ZJ347 TaxID=3342117 RepID=UPI0035A859C8
MFLEEQMMFLEKYGLFGEKTSLFVERCKYTYIHFIEKPPMTDTPTLGASFGGVLGYVVQEIMCVVPEITKLIQDITAAFPEILPVVPEIMSLDLHPYQEKTACSTPHRRPT